MPCCAVAVVTVTEPLYDPGARPFELAVTVSVVGVVPLICVTASHPPPDTVCANTLNVCVMPVLLTATDCDPPAAKTRADGETVRVTGPATVRVTGRI